MSDPQPKLFPMVVSSGNEFSVAPSSSTQSPHPSSHMSDCSNTNEAKRPQSTCCQHTQLTPLHLTLISKNSSSTEKRAIGPKIPHNLSPKSTLQASASILQGISLASPASKSSPFLAKKDDSTHSSSRQSAAYQVAKNGANARSEYAEKSSKQAKVKEGPTQIIIHSPSSQNSKYPQKQDHQHAKFQHQNQATNNNNSPQQKPFQPTQNQVQKQQTESTPLRRGKWTPEEEAYASAVIQAFSSGYLDALPGTTLRTYLSEKLQCDPMRITKKFTGDSSIGKKVFHPVGRSEASIKIIEETQVNLEMLYEEWKQRLESQRQESTRKSLAAEAVSAVSTLCNAAHTELLPAVPSSSSLVQDFLPARGNKSGMRVPSEQIQNHDQKMVHNTIVRTVSWLEHAESILSKKELPARLSNYSHANSFQASRGAGRGARASEDLSQLISNIELEMSEISRLISQGPAILSNTRSLGRTSNRPYLDGPRQDHGAIRIMPYDKSKAHKPETNLGIREAHRERNQLSPIVEEEVSLDSPSCPMKILASLSSQAAPVPIVDEEEDKRKGKLSHLPDQMGSEWKSNKRFKVDASNSSSADENSQLKANTEDAKTFVNFLQSVVQG